MEGFIDHMFPNIDKNDSIPEGIILTPTNEVNSIQFLSKLNFEEMNRVNDIILKKYKPDEDVETSIAWNTPYNDAMNFSKKKMEEFVCGCLPPQNLHLKIGFILMLLRNWRLSEGLANGTRLRLLRTGPKLCCIECEIITGPRYEKPIVYLFMKYSYCILRK